MGMRMFVVGASGGTGKHVVQRALEAGHEVVAFVRNPAAFSITHKRLHVEKGDALDVAAIGRASKGCEAAISTVGPRAGTPPGTLISSTVGNVLAAMKNGGPRRFVFESGLMVGDGRGLSFLGRIGLRIYRRMNQALYEDKVRAESAIRASPGQWVIVRPPALAEKAPRGTYRVGVDLDASATVTMAHADVAAFLVEAAAGDQWIGKIVDISY